MLFTNKEFEIYGEKDKKNNNSTFRMFHNCELQSDSVTRDFIQPLSR